MNSKLLFWIPLVSLLLMIIWGFIGWFLFGIERAGVLGDSMQPINSLLTAFALGAAIYSLDLQRRELITKLNKLEQNKEKEATERRWNQFIAKLEYLDAKNHVNNDNCPWCNMLDNLKDEKTKI